MTADRSRSPPKASATPMASSIHRHADMDKVAVEVGAFLGKIAKEAVADHGFFSVALSGGSMVQVLSKSLLGGDVDLSKWRIAFADERLVPPDDVESTYGLYQKGLLAQLPEDQRPPASSVLAIDHTLPVDECATQYEKQLVAALPGQSDEPPKFDLILLGMGPDGHTASLFPGHKLLEEQSSWVASIADSPKPPAERITLTLRTINSAKEVAFVTGGSSKAPVLKEIMEGGSKLPAALIKPYSGALHWFVDAAALPEGDAK